MDLAKKLALLEETLDTEEGVLKPETVLDDVESWDSLAMLSLIAMLDEEFNRTISGKELKALKTVGEILTYME